MAHVKGREDGSESDASGPLDIVVEAGNLGTVLLQQTPRYCALQFSTWIYCEQAAVEGCLTVCEAKVFKVNISTRVQLSRRLHERIDEVIVFLSSHALVPKPKIQIIIAQ